MIRVGEYQNLIPPIGNYSFPEDASKQDRGSGSIGDQERRGRLHELTQLHRSKQQEFDSAIERIDAIYAGHQAELERQRTREIRQTHSEEKAQEGLSEDSQFHEKEAESGLNMERLRVEQAYRQARLLVNITRDADRRAFGVATQPFETRASSIH